MLYIFAFILDILLYLKLPLRYGVIVVIDLLYSVVRLENC